MATEAAKGRANVDGLTSFLGLVLIWTSSIAFVIQVWLTSRIHRYLGIGFALLVLPIGFGSTAIVMLLNAALWAPSLARVLDQSLRYTVDKTTREILFLPLPTDLKYRAKPFVDVTVDRVAKGVSGLLMLILVKPWGLNLNWQQVSFASLIIVGLWIATALRVKRQYVAAFRDSLTREWYSPIRCVSRRRTSRPSRPWCRSSDTRTSSGCCTRSTFSRASTKAVWSRRCCSTTKLRRFVSARCARSPPRAAMAKPPRRRTPPACAAAFHGCRRSGGC